MRKLPLVVVLVCAFSATAAAKRARPRPPEVVGLVAEQRFAPAAGFIEAAVADDGVSTLAYVVADAAGKAEVHLVDVTTGKELRVIDVSSITVAPTRLWLIGTGKQARLIVAGPRPAGDGDDEADDLLVAGILDTAGQEDFRVGPAERIEVIAPGGKPELVLRTTTTDKKGATVHQLERRALRGGKRLGKVKKLVLAGNRNDKLAFTVSYWTEGGTRAVGLRDGKYDKKKDMRLPGTEAIYDLATGTFVVDRRVTDPRALKERHERYANQEVAYAAPSTFVRVSDDLAGLERWTVDGRTAITLDQPFALYEPASLVVDAGDGFVIGDGGPTHLALSVDPWNRPAVERKKADEAYIDLYRAEPAGAATRVGRILAPKKKLLIGAVGERIWVLERNAGFRGGKQLTVYAIAP